MAARAREVREGCGLLAEWATIRLLSELLVHRLYDLRTGMGMPRKVHSMGALVMPEGGLGSTPSRERQQES